jgi:hypothetical protein
MEIWLADEQAAKFVRSGEISALKWVRACALAMGGRRIAAGLVNPGRANRFGRGQRLE